MPVSPFALRGVGGTPARLPALPLRFGSGLVPFRGWFGAALRDEGQPLLTAPDPDHCGWKGRWRGGSRGRGGARGGPVWLRVRRAPAAAEVLPIRPSAKTQLPKAFERFIQT